MEEAIKILIVEDEMLIGAKISLQLSNLGYEVTGIVARGKEAIQHIAHERPDMVLLDINLKGDVDGIETAHVIKKEYDIPIIFLTANSDEEHFERAKATQPEAFISKPFKKLDLERAVALISNKLRASNDTLGNRETHRATVLDDSIFVRQRDELVKVYLQDILFVEADRNYCKINTRGKAYTIVMTLKEMDEKLTHQNFIRIHRSYVVNLSHIEKVGNTHLTIEKKILPVSKSYKEDLLKRLQTF
ncbi:LytR/AlgR family response regulator transcription factor [Poritiphilus flavus]|uniref:Response regulator n=1 Tax=Poritiphilus flavus TaxID=2697053 RepID=A0A6L9EBL3_9FLAO|nr:response regulator [Poritiphilus flavus]NAS11961.1 response regulator [Poritiphilus flavus]